MEANTKTRSGNKIVRRDNFFRKYFFLLFGVILLSLFSLNALLGDGGVFTIGSLILGIWYCCVHFYHKKKNGSNESFILWDNEKILVRELPKPASIYTWDKVNEVRISNDHLTIKSGAANGTMLDLKRYSEQDKAFLKAEMAERNET